MIMSMVKLNKRAQVAGLNLIPAIAIAVVIGFTVLGVGSDVLQNINDAQTANTAADNATQAGLDALVEFSDFGTSIGVVGAAVVLLTLLAVGLGGLQGRL